MIVRVVKGRKETDHPCDHVRLVTWDDGLDFILYDRNGREMRTIQLPQHGSKIYYMNDKGDTTDMKCWPPREDKERGRQGVTSGRELRV